MIGEGERGEHRELFWEGRQGLLGLPGGVIGAGWVKRIVGRVGGGGRVVLSVRVGMLRGLCRIGTGGVRGMLRVGIVVMMRLRMVLVILVTGTAARWGITTALGIDTRGRRGMGMGIDGRDGVLVLVRRMAGCVGWVGKRWGRGVIGGRTGMGVRGL